MVKTRYPGIYKRGNRYVATWHIGGRQRKKSARTLEEAKALRAKMQAAVASGEYGESSRLGFREYAEQWLPAHQGLRNNTREEYRRLLERYAFPFLEERLKRTVGAITPRDIAQFVGWLADETAQAEHDYELAMRDYRRALREADAARARGEKVREPRPPTRKVAKRLSDSSIQNAVKPVRACLRTATELGDIRHNPADRVRLPKRPRPQEDDEEQVRVFTREQLRTLLELVHPSHRLMFRLLAASGLRVSELIALRWKDLRLDGARPAVKVRRAIVRGEEGAPKSRHGRREVPLPFELVSGLRRRRDDVAPGGEDLVFASETGTPLMPGNVRRRVLAPAAEEAGVPWAGFHAFRHTFASLHIERGTNIVQLSRLLGHHSAAFTLSVYAHLIDGNVGEALSLDQELGLASELALSPGWKASHGDTGHEPREEPIPAL